MFRGKILVVDDEPEIVSSVSMRLRACGYDVVTATDGMTATNAALRESPDLIILDIAMPKGNGHTVVSRLRDSQKAADIPVIFLTAHTNEKDYQKAFRAGVEQYITKPFQPEELLAAVDGLIRRSSGAEGRSAESPPADH